MKTAAIVCAIMCALGEADGFLNNGEIEKRNIRYEPEKYSLSFVISMELEWKSCSRKKVKEINNGHGYQGKRNLQPNMGCL